MEAGWTKIVAHNSSVDGTAADNLVYVIYIQRLLGARFRKVNLFFKSLIFLRISRFIPRFTFGIGIA